VQLHLATNCPSSSDSNRHPRVESCPYPTVSITATVDKSNLVTEERESEQQVL
jgi:hypothetical protein